MSPVVRITASDLMLICSCYKMSRTYTRSLIYKSIIHVFKQIWSVKGRRVKIPANVSMIRVLCSPSSSPLELNRCVTRSCSTLQNKQRDVSPAVLVAPEQLIDLWPQAGEVTPAYIFCTCNKKPKTHFWKTDKNAERAKTSQRRVI